MLYLDTLSVTINIWKDNRSNKEITKANQNICAGIRETRNKSYLSQNLVIKPQTDLFMLYVNDRDKIKNIYIKLTTKPKITFVYRFWSVSIGSKENYLCSYSHSKIWYKNRHLFTISKPVLLFSGKTTRIGKHQSLTKQISSNYISVIRQFRLYQFYSSFVHFGDPIMYYKQTQKNYKTNLRCSLLQNLSFIQQFFLLPSCSFIFI